MPAPEEVEQVLRRVPGYRTAFGAAFPGEPEPVTFDNVANAIAAFERVLMTPSRWDRFLQGDLTAISASERAGFMAFQNF